MGLGVIFVASCVGVFFLLRYRPHGGRTTRDKSGEVGNESPFPKRRGTLFGFRSKNPRKGGWVPAPNTAADDDWDDGFDRVRGERLGAVVEAGYDNVSLNHSVTAPTQPAQPRSPAFDIDNNEKDNVRSYSNSTFLPAKELVRGHKSTSSIELAVPNRVGGPDHMYSDPFGGPAPLRSTSPVLYDDSIRSGSPTPQVWRPGHQQSGSSVTSLTLPAGTKFRESL